MIGDFFLAFGKGIGLLFLQPFLYVYFLIILWTGYRRVKRERKQFSYRIFDSFEELRQSFVPGLVVGICISIITMGIGIVLPKAALFLLTIVMVLFGIVAPLVTLTPSLVFGFVSIVMIIFPNFLTSLQLEWTVSAGAVVFLVGALFMLAEGILVTISSKGATTPSIYTGKRGKKIGAHIFQRVWMLPVFFLVPGSMFSTTFEFWPVLSLGGHEFDILLFPVGIGFIHTIQSSLPQQNIKRIGKELIVFAVVITLVAVGGLYEPFVAVGGAFVAIIGRVFISIRARGKEYEKANFFMPANDGVVILSIIPKSLAERMHLAVGEKIVKVNGFNVTDETSFYEAIEKNRAFCKLEVIDIHGEPRIIQKATYTDDHHELGVILA